MKVFINGRYVSAKKATVSVHDRGLNYGDGLFETIRAYGGEPFQLGGHLRRLRSSARALSIPARVLVGVDGRIKKLIHMNGLTRADSYIKIILTRGAAAGATAGLGTSSKGSKPTLIITAARIDAKVVEGLQTKGVGAVTVEGSAALGGLKTLNYLPSVMARMEAERRGAYEAVFIKDGKVLEGAATNIFAVKKDTIITPPEAAVLPGITRALVMKIAGKAGFKVKEGPLTLKQLASSTEAFLTNSLVEVVPLVKVNSKKLGDGRVGCVTRAIQELYRVAVRRVRPAS